VIIGLILFTIGAFVTALAVGTGIPSTLRWHLWKAAAIAMGSAEFVAGLFVMIHNVK
jgi:hypothetical protein